MAKVWPALFGEGSLDAAGQAMVTVFGVFVIARGGWAGVAYGVLLVVWAYVKGRRNYWQDQLVQEYERRYGRLD